MTPTAAQPTTYHLVRHPTGTAAAPQLDEFQQQVVDHAGGPLLVLAGPGTGKTTTLVEAIVDRIETRGVSPDEVLALTFSRKAAEQLRDRVTARLGRTMSTTMSSTFHSFAYGLIRKYSPADLYEAPLRLLSAPEQDVILQRLLTDAPESVVWPESVRGALGTRGFAKEVAAVLARAQEKGLGFTQLRGIGLAEGVSEFVAAAAFMEQYDQVMGDQNLLDYPSLIAGAVAMLQDPERPVRDDLRRQFRCVFVDEYQDTDPAQVALLKAIAGDSRDLTVVGDPHQSIYGFRGAEVRGILQFPTEFRHSRGAPADVVVLRTTRRFGPRLLRASQRVAGRLPFPGSVDEAARSAFLAPRAEVGPHDDGRVDVLTFDTERAEAEHLADLLRRAHLEDGIGWSDMAVLVRSGRTSIPALRRSLSAAGVPVEVASDDTPLVQEPAVRPLVDALGAVVNLANEDPKDDGYVDAQRAHGLFQSPLAGLDASDVRTVARLLRVRERAGAEAEGRSPRSSPELLRAALVDASVLEGPDGGVPALDKAAALSRLLARARARLVGGAPAEEVLWELWSGTGWPARLEAAIARGGPAARLAHRDLDAVCALFEAAAKVEEQRGHTSVQSFLDTLAAQQIPADTLAERGIRGDAVRLLTAHRSKGLEWRLVVVAHVQEEGWPDLRRRATLLQADRIGSHGLVPSVSIRELLADERRLFYVACTRARERLVVTAVASTEDDGEQQSRFLEELGIRIEHRQGRPARPLSLVGLVAELRRTLADDRNSDSLRRAAATRLAALTAEHRAGRAWVPAADPASWWGTRSFTRSEAPIQPVDEPVPLSASALTSLAQCPAKWFLESEAGGERASTQSQGFGNVVHALADRIGRGELPVDPRLADALVDELMVHVDTVWEQIPFRTPWSSGREREEVRRALARFLAWHQRPGARTVIATEQQLRAEVRLPDGQRVVLHGYADRLEVDDDGKVIVIDLKTSKYVPSGDEILVHPQLGLYQLAVENGAVDGVVGGKAEPGGAELWQLRHEAYRKLKVQHQTPQQPDEDGRRPIELQLMAAARSIRDERFPARPGGHCEHCDFQPLCPAKTSGTVLS